jgi:hypothetical protein
MKPLIDGDILIHEVAFTCQGPDPETGELVISGFDHAKERMDTVIAQICYGAGGTLPPKIFLTGKNNFRIDIATKKGYKANREGNKPFHYKNLKEYLLNAYDTEVVEGVEADDALCITQTKALAAGEPTIICSRDKDLRQCGKQASWGPHLVEGFGEIIADFYPEGHRQAGRLKKLLGTGDKWFLAQLLMGDPVDNVPGLPGWGPVKVYNLLKDVEDYEKGLFHVIQSYQEYYWGRLNYDDAWIKNLVEQAQLVWMVRELNEDGSPKMWRMDD